MPGILLQKPLLRLPTGSEVPTNLLDTITSRFCGNPIPEPMQRVLNDHERLGLTPDLLQRDLASMAEDERIRSHLEVAARIVENRYSGQPEHVDTVLYSLFAHDIEVSPGVRQVTRFTTGRPSWVKKSASLLETLKEKRLLDEIDEILSILSIKYNGSDDDRHDFVKGNCYIQHSAQDVTIFRQGVRKIIAKYHGEDGVQVFDRGQKDELWDCFGRSSPYLHAYLISRSLSIDEDNREWGQPVFVEDPAQLSFSSTSPPYAMPVVKLVQFFINPLIASAFIYSVDHQGFDITFAGSTFDHKEFDDLETAEKYKQVVDFAREGQALLPLPQDNEWIHVPGTGVYYPHFSDDIEKFKAHIRKGIAQFYGENWAEVFDRNPRSVAIGRTIGDYNELAPLSYLLDRFYQTDDTGREWRLNRDTS